MKASLVAVIDGIAFMEIMEVVEVVEVVEAVETGMNAVTCCVTCCVANTKSRDLDTI